MVRRSHALFLCVFPTLKPPASSIGVLLVQHIWLVRFWQQLSSSSSRSEHHSFQGASIAYWNSVLQWLIDAWRQQFKFSANKNNLGFSLSKVFSDVGKWEPELAVVDLRQDRVQMSKKAQHRSNRRADHREKHRPFRRNIRTVSLPWVMSLLTRHSFESEVA